MAISSNGHYRMSNDYLKVQLESIVGGASGWVFQNASKGNNPGFQGTGYYYWKTQQGTNTEKTANKGVFSAKFYVEESGTYDLRVRSTRDDDSPADAANDIWVKLNENANNYLPKGYGEMVSNNGFIKHHKANSKGWGESYLFDTKAHGGGNPASKFVLDKGFHTITFAGRSEGYHADSFMLFKGTKPGANAANSTFVSTSGTSTSSALAQTSEPTPTAPSSGDTTVAEVAKGANDWEAGSSGASSALDFGVDGGKAVSVGMIFSGATIARGAEIESAHFVFKAATSSSGKANFRIAVEDTKDAQSYSSGNDPDDRDYLGQTVAWSDVQTWKKGATYKSADVADLIEAVIDGGGLAALDTLAFRVTGSGARDALSFEGGAAPQLVIDVA